MLPFLFKNKPKLSIVVVFYNMKREAKRTLFSLTATYQKDIAIEDYEVLVVDSNSSEPLDKSWVESIQKNFTYKYVETEWPSPCKAMNTGIHMANAEQVVCMIDGARILSPRILTLMKSASNQFSNSLIQTIAMHIGDEVQMKSVEKGYNQILEDRILDNLDWENDGYKLFDVSCLAANSINGFLFPIKESNCFCVSKKTLHEIGGFDERFTSPGGGIVNNDTLKKILEDLSITPITLLGEATFHQFHGGVATNVPMLNHPSKSFRDEYKKLRGEYFKPVYRRSNFLGTLPENTLKFVFTKERNGEKRNTTR